MYRGLANGRCRPVKRIGNSELHQSNVRSDTRTFSFFWPGIPRKPQEQKRGESETPGLVSFFTGPTER